VPMECTVWTRSESADEELVANVQSLRDQLRRTEKSLQSLGEELSRYECVWELRVFASVSSKGIYASTNEALNMFVFQIFYLESTLGTRLVSIPKLEERIVNLEAEVSAQDKILRDAEDKLEQSQKTIMERESMLHRYKKDYKNLKMELIEQSKQGKRTEQQRNEALLNAEELTRVFKKYNEKIIEKLEKVQAEKEALEKYLMNCEKEKEKLNENCISYRKDLDILEEQLRKLRKENHNTKEEIKTLEAKNAEMVSVLSQSNQKILELESELSEKETILKEKNALISENTKLKALTAQQHNRLKLCHQEIEDSREEVNVLETIISQLSLSTSEERVQIILNNYLFLYNSIELAMKEAEIRKPHADLTVCNIEHLLDDNERQEKSRLCGLETEPVKLIRDQGGKLAKKLHSFNTHIMTKQFEKERQRFKKEIEELCIKLTKIDDENSFLKTSMAQSASQFQIIQEELLEKASKTNSLEQEIVKKSSQLLALEKQLEEKAVTYSAAAARNTELEQELMGKNSRIRELETTVSEEHEQITSAFEKAKLVHLEQHREMEKQIELLQTQLDKKHQQLVQQEKTISVLQQDVIHKQHHIESLDELLIESREEVKKQNIKKDEGLKILQSRLTEQTIKVKQLESALDICKEELALFLSQSEENKEMFENQLKKKSEEVFYLQKEIKLKGHDLQDTSEQNIILQQTLHHHQQMLQQETIRNGELEDNQTKLEKQVSTLEQELQKQKARAEDELRKVEQKLCLASQEADLNRMKVDELNSIIRQIKLEMDQYKNELTIMEKEVVQLKRDAEDKAMQINQLDITLKEAQSELNEKTNEDKLLQSETCHREALQKIVELEYALQNANEELKITLTQLQELQEALQNAQSSLEEKHVAVMSLTAELRYCKGEMEDKKQELLDMDQALKERNWELKQRAAQITQLDMTVREHRGEMEQQIIQLESNLEKSELEVKECNKQIESLENKLQHSKDELREKEFEILQRDQEINQLKKKIERKQQSLERVKNQGNCIGDQYKEALDLGQQLKLEREQLQHTHSELAETRRMLVQAQREADRLSHELEELNHLSQEKESRANRLAEELGAAKVHEAQLEVQMQSEINRLSAEICSLKDACQREKCAHLKDQAKRQIPTQHQKFGSYYLSGQLQQMKRDLAEAQDTVTNLQQQLQVRDEMFHAASEALLEVRENISYL
uniref:Coiled-coil domain containing 18 n=1 Tax=Anser brachyrhynchus TaxID=132585 RepID=A0A8B9CAV7_9AVES